MQTLQIRAEEGQLEIRLHGPEAILLAGVKCSHRAALGALKGMILWAALHEGNVLTVCQLVVDDLPVDRAAHIWTAGRKTNDAAIM